MRLMTIHGKTRKSKGGSTSTGCSLAATAMEYLRQLLEEVRLKELDKREKIELGVLSTFLARIDAETNPLPPANSTAKLPSGSKRQANSEAAEAVTQASSSSLIREPKEPVKPPSPLQSKPYL